MTDRLLRPDEIAVLLGFTVRTIRRWVAAGEIVSERYHGQIRIPESQVEALRARARGARASGPGASRPTSR
jgi:excisionase family DNA binding protein